MQPFVEQAVAYRAIKNSQVEHAGQVAAVQLICGVDLEAALRGDSATARAVVRRLERAIERERLRGWRLHWSYDLNRHIALKQALDRVRVGMAGSRERGPPTKNGA